MQVQNNYAGRILAETRGSLRRLLLEQTWQWYYSKSSDPDKELLEEALNSLYKHIGLKNQYYETFKIWYNETIEKMGGSDMTGRETYEEMVRQAITNTGNEFVVKSSRLPPDAKKEIPNLVYLQCLVMGWNAKTENPATREEQASGREQLSLVIEKHTQRRSASTSAASVPPQLEKQMRKKIMEIAEKYVGTPYYWGGNALSDGGLDCSGYARLVLKEAGVVDLPDMMAWEILDKGTRIPRSQLQPGDLVGFIEKKSGSTVHVGFFTKSDEYLSAADGWSKTFGDNPNASVKVKSFVTGERRDVYFVSIKPLLAAAAAKK